MKKKIEQFLMAMLIITALLLLLITEMRPAVPVKVPAPTETTAATEPTQIPADITDRVTNALREHLSVTTATTHCVYDPDLLAEKNTLGSGQDAAAFTLAQLCGEQHINPIDGFWALAKEGVYDRSRDTTGVLKSQSFFTPLQKQQTYAFSMDGARELLTDLLTLASGMQDGLPMEEQILGDKLMLDEDHIFLSAENCFCAYYVCYGDRSAHFLCFYLRGEENITDVEFQLMNLHYAVGNQDAVTWLDEVGDRQVVTLMTALELLMTGRTRAAKGDIPFAYDLEDCTAGITRYSLTGSGESGYLTCYRIRK